MRLALESPWGRRCFKGAVAGLLCLVLSAFASQPATAAPGKADQAAAEQSVAETSVDEPAAAEETPERPARAAPKPSAKGTAQKAADKKPVAKDAIPRNVQRSILQRIKGKKPELRTEGVRELGDYESVEAAKMLVQNALSSKFEEVRKAGYETLLGFRDNEEICEYLLDAAKKDIAKGTPKDTTCAMLAVALASDLEPVQEKAGEALSKAAKQPKGGLLLLVTLADQLGREGNAASLATLLKLTKQPLFDEEFAFRRSVIQALTQVQEFEAVDALIEILGTAKGEVRGDISRYLASISGEEHGIDAKAWQTWWEGAKEDFEFPPKGAKAAPARLAAKATSAYYGLPIYGQRLVFVIDASLSMRGARIEAAKRELISAINGLPEGVYFNVLAFHVSVAPWQRKLAVASPEHKQQAAAFVQSLGLGHATASYDALEAAMDFDAESIYFLTDGAPRGGKVDHPVEIVDVLTRLNHTRRVTINSIGIGVGPEGSVFDDFLRTLAEQNYGEYRRVNE